MSGGQNRGDIAQAFGAKVRVTMPDQGLYIVVGHSMLPSTAVQQAGGRVMFVVPNSTRLFAVMPATAFLALRSHPDIALVGPVTVDTQRFNQFVDLLRLHQQSQIG